MESTRTPQTTNLQHKDYMFICLFTKIWKIYKSL